MIILYFIVVHGTAAVLKQRKTAENNHRFRFGYYRRALVFFLLHIDKVDSYYTYCSADDFGEETCRSFAQHRVLYYKYVYVHLPKRLQRTKYIIIVVGTHSA